MKIAVTGPHGRLGSALVRSGAVPINSDITDFEHLQAEIQEISPDVVINCAAKTSHSWCEEHPKESLAINYHGAVNVRKAFDGWLIHISTDWIFDGKEGPYTENAKPSPLNSYGWGKWGAEIMLEAFVELPYSIIRTTILYDAITTNFATVATNTLKQGKEFFATPDMFGNPTYIPHFVTALYDFIDRKLDYIHILNLSGKTWISRCGFAQNIAEKLFCYAGLVIPKMPIGLYKTMKYPPLAGFKLTFAESLSLPLYTLDEGLEEFAHGITV